MTCIAAVIQDGIGYIAGERGASTDSTIMRIAEPKVWSVNGYLIGYYGTFATEKLKFNFNPTPVGNNDLLTFMNSQFIEELHEAYETCHINPHEDTELLIIAGGKIFVHNSEDMSMTMYDTDFFAQGSGADYAMGSLHTTSAFEMEPEVRLIAAMEAAVDFSPTCIGPIDIITTKD